MPSFHSWLASLFSTWHFKSQNQHYLLSIQLGQTKLMATIKHKGVPGSTHHLEALRDRINTHLDAHYSAAALYIEDQKVALKLSWGVSIGLFESSLRKVGMTLLTVAKLIFEDIFPTAINAETDKKEGEELYGVRPLSIDF